MLQKLASSPVIAVLLRVFALFQAYNVLTKDKLQPITFAAVSFLFVAVAQLFLGVSRPQKLRGVPFRTALLTCLYGGWSAINHVTLLTSLVKLHPLRFAIGEYFEVALAYFMYRRTRLSSVDALPGGDVSNLAGSKLRQGALLFSVAAVCLGWASNLYTYTPGEQKVEGGDPEDLTQVMDSVGGMMLLCIYVVSEVLKKRLRSRLILELGEDEGQSPDTLATFFGSLVLFPLAVGVTLVGGTGELSSSGAFIGVVINSILILLVPSVISAKRRALGRENRKKLSAEFRVLSALATALAFHFFYHTHYQSTGNGENPTTSMTHTHPVLHLDNILVVICAALLGVGLRLLAMPPGSDLGGSAGAGIDDTTLLFAPTSDEEAGLLSSIFDNPKERKLFVFFMLTLFFMFVELLYGIHVNSLGLVSDSFHMLLDSLSIAIGLYAAHMAKWKANESHPFGYGRYEILSGFTNGILLLFIGVYVFVEAVGRFSEPPEIKQGYLLGVSVLGLCVNIAGLTLFFDGAHGHSHGGHGHSHGGGHCHSHGGGDDVNLRAVYLHILADFMGSVSVITSSLIVHFTGWMIADPICSAFISCLIFMAAMPIINASGTALLQGTPQGVSLSNIREQFSKLDGVRSVKELHVFTLATTPEQRVMVTVNLECTGDGSQNDSNSIVSRVVGVLKANNLGPEENYNIEVEFVGK